MADRLRTDCVKCMLKQLDNAPKNCSEDERLQYVQRVLRVLACADKTASGPVLMRQIYDIQKELFGMEKDYTDVKKYFNALLLDREPEIKKRVKASEEPLKMAVQYAMIGNYIDFGAMNTVSEEKLNEFISGADAGEVNQDEYAAMCRDLDSAKNVVYLTDNCGEIVFDKVLIEEISDTYKNAHITVMVKGGPVLNDATMEDAVQVGLAGRYNVIGNGNNTAGTCLEKLSEEAKSVIDAADIIISKGQANYETLRKCRKNVYYIFMCKCEMFAKEFDVPKYTGILVNDKNCV